MDHELYTILTPIRKRLHQQAVLRGAAAGLLVGAVIALALGGLRWAVAGLLGSWAVGGWAMIGWAAAGGTIAVAGLLTGMWRGSRHEASWRSIAQLVDSHYRLDDRTLTALAFLEKPERRALEDRQIADALAHLAPVKSEELMPGKTPGRLLAGAALVAIAGALLAWPIASTRLTAVAVTPPAENVAAKPEKPPQAESPEALRKQLDWKPAASGATTVGRIDLYPGVSLEKMLVLVETKATEQAGAKVVQEELPQSMEHRQAVRRYFESVRPEGQLGSHAE